jgi:hypothetical protein
MFMVDLAMIVPSTLSKNATLVSDLTPKALEKIEYTHHGPWYEQAQEAGSHFNPHLFYLVSFLLAKKMLENSGPKRPGKLVRWCMEKIWWQNLKWLESVNIPAKCQFSATLSLRVA